MNKRYEELMGRGRRYSLKHPPIPNKERAAQFAPFAALDGHGDALLETARVTEHETELTEEEKTILDQKLQSLRQRLDLQPQVTVGYFKADERKAGGAYLTKTACLKKMEEYPAALYFADDSRIPVDWIRWIEGDWDDRREE